MIPFDRAAIVDCLSAAAAAPLSCAKLCLEGARQQPEQQEAAAALREMPYQASCVGNVKLLEWACNKEHGFELNHFGLAALKGHLSALKWAEEKHLEWHSK